MNIFLYCTAVRNLLSTHTWPVLYDKTSHGIEVTGDSAMWLLKPALYNLFCDSPVRSEGFIPSKFKKICIYVLVIYLSLDVVRKPVEIRICSDTCKYLKFESPKCTMAKAEYISSEHRYIIISFFQAIPTNHNNTLL